MGSLRSHLKSATVLAALFSSSAICAQPLHAEPADLSPMSTSSAATIPDGWSGDFVWKNAFGGGTTNVSILCRPDSNCVLTGLGNAASISFDRRVNVTSLTSKWKDAGNVFAVSDVVWAVGSDFSADPGWVEECRPWPECESNANKIKSLWMLSNVSGVPVEPWSTSGFSGLKLGENLGTNSRSSISNVRLVMTLFYEEGRFDLYAVWGGATDKDCLKDARRCVSIGIGGGRTESKSQKAKWTTEVSPTTPTLGDDITVKLAGGCGRPVGEAIGLKGPLVSFEIVNQSKKTYVRGEKLDENTIIYSWRFKSQEPSRLVDGRPVYDIRITASPRGAAGARAICINPNKDTVNEITIVAEIKPSTTSTTTVKPRFDVETKVTTLATSNFGGPLWLGEEFRVDVTKVVCQSPINRESAPVMQIEILDENNSLAQPVSVMNAVTDSNGRVVRYQSSGLNAPEVSGRYSLSVLVRDRESGFCLGPNREDRKFIKTLEIRNRLRFIDNPYLPESFEWGARPVQCPKVMILGFRGSGEQPVTYKHGDSNTLLTTGQDYYNWLGSGFKIAERFSAPNVRSVQDRVWYHEVFGPTVGEHVRALRLNLGAKRGIPSSEVGIWSVGVDDLHLTDLWKNGRPQPVYNAPGVPDWKALSKGPTKYVDSISLDLAKINIKQHINRYFSDTCPGVQEVYAIGYSQGALIARFVMADLAARLPSKKLGLLLLADPAFSYRNEKCCLHYTNAIDHVWGDSDASGVAEFFPLKPELVELAKQMRVLTVCVNNDLVCDFGLGGSKKIHSVAYKNPEFSMIRLRASRLSD